jgi:hypothetical protein
MHLLVRQPYHYTRNRVKQISFSGLPARPYLVVILSEAKDLCTPFDSGAGHCLCPLLTTDLCGLRSSHGAPMVFSASSAIPPRTLRFRIFSAMLAEKSRGSEVLRRPALGPFPATFLKNSCVLGGSVVISIRSYHHTCIPYFLAPRRTNPSSCRGYAV